MQKSKMKNIIILPAKIVTIVVSLFFIAEHYFFEIEPLAISPTFILSFFVLIALNWYTQTYKKENYFKPSHILLITVLLFLAVHLRAGIYWALNTFPLRDANTVFLTLQEPFDDFAYGMVKLYLTTTIPQALIITAILTIFLYTVLNRTKTRLFVIGTYFAATIVLFISVIPTSDYIHIINNEPEKNAIYSKFFAENYVNPDSVKITAPEQKKNLILIYLESLETTFSDKEHGGNQDINLIPEITELAQQNLSFGRIKKNIGGGFDAIGSSSTFGAMITRSLGIPDIANYKKTPILHHYKSLYKILNNNGYKQIFIQGNSGFYNGFRNFMTDQKINEVYGPDDLIQRLNLDTTNLTKSKLFKSVHDKDVFKAANQILDTISEPFTLTFFTIDTHSPHGFYDPNCIKSLDEKNEDELLKASVRCASRELSKFLVSIKAKPFYENTSIIIFGDHLFMGTRLVKGFKNRKWINIFINSPKAPTSNEVRLFSDIDMFPTILSTMDFNINGDRLGFGTDLFSSQKTLVESIGLDSLNKEINKMSSHLIYESILLQKKK
ncbi:phosphoglycerol transferase [Fibrobacter sp. UWT2]|uniref:LTA synthase family protein n=1 Tax=Fibrobacter sp. UWT2 TaxID=1896224 RepID=UPI00091F6D40|nr:LTA synthase family protein [Fibrobacter sp. UWT2]SHL56508.1 phosphoglycerol transferase [Fibrobacter sp. UWT2]